MYMNWIFVHCTHVGYCFADPSIMEPQVYISRSATNLIHCNKIPFILSCWLKSSSAIVVCTLPFNIQLGSVYCIFSDFDGRIYRKIGSLDFVSPISVMSCCFTLYHTLN